VRSDLCIDRINQFVNRDASFLLPACWSCLSASADEIPGDAGIGRILAGAVALKFGVRGETAKNRILNFINGTELPFQAKHARIAVATGAITVKARATAISETSFLIPIPTLFTRS